MESETPNPKFVTRSSPCIVTASKSFQTLILFIIGQPNSKSPSYLQDLQIIDRLERALSQTSAESALRHADEHSYCHNSWVLEAHQIFYPIKINQTPLSTFSAHLYLPFAGIELLDQSLDLPHLNVLVLNITGRFGVHFLSKRSKIV